MSVVYTVVCRQTPKRHQSKKNKQKNETDPSTKIAFDRNDNRHNNQHQHQPQQAHQLDILPPHPPLQPPAAHAELARAAPQPVRLVYQQVNPLAALQKALDVARHDAAHVVNLAARVAERVVAPRPRRAVVHHERAQVAVEGRRAIVGQVGKVGRGGGVPREEAVARLDEEAEGDASPEGAVGDDEEDEAAGGGVGGRVLRGGLGDVVDVVRAVRVGELLRGAVVDLGEDEGGEGRGLRGG